MKYVDICACKLLFFGNLIIFLLWYFCFFVCDNYWKDHRTCFSSGIFTYREILQLPHSTLPLISSACTLMGYKEKGKGEKDNLAWVYAPCSLRKLLCRTYWAESVLSARESLRRNTRAVHSPVRKSHRHRAGYSTASPVPQKCYKRTSTIVNGPAQVVKHRRKHHLQTGECSKLK